MLESIDHVNLVVNDLEGMAEFYSALLGLTPTKRATISGPWIAAVVGLTDVEADVIYLDLPAGPRVELLRYNRPPAARPEGLGRSNTPGLGDIAFRVRDPDEILSQLAGHGVRFTVVSGPVEDIGHDRADISVVTGHQYAH